MAQAMSLNGVTLHENFLANLLKKLQEKTFFYYFFSKNLIW